MNREQMQNDAQESMNRERKGYGWCKTTQMVFQGIITAIFKSSFSIAGDGFLQDVDHFSFTDPRPREAPPKGTLLLVKYKNTVGWLAHFSTGKLDFKGKLITVPVVNELKFDDRKESSIEEWRLPEDGKVPEDLI